MEETVRRIYMRFKNRRPS